jgi:hypothetical protein
LDYQIHILSFGKEKNQRYCQISLLSSSFTFLFRKNSSSGITAGLCDNSRGLGYESTQLSSEEDEKEREENSHVLESHRDSLLRNVMIIDDELDALLF